MEDTSSSSQSSPSLDRIPAARRPLRDGEVDDDQTLVSSSRGSSAVQPNLPAIIVTPNESRIMLVESVENGSSALPLSKEYALATLFSRNKNGRLSAQSNVMALSRKRRGWDNLSVGILHNILSFALEDNELDTVLHHNYGSHSTTHEIAQVLVDRVWLCRMRLVSSKWKGAVDSHPFWPSYTLILDPSRAHDSTITDYHSPRLTPSTPSFTTLFHRARSITLKTCLACRLNHPSRLGLYPAIRKRITSTTKLGLAPTCERHYQNFCANCLSEEPSSGIRGSQHAPKLGAKSLLAVTQLDKNEDGKHYLAIMRVCSECRHFALAAEIQKHLAIAARGGQLRGERSKWEVTQAYKQYVNTEGGRTVVATAPMVIEEQWYIDHTRFLELLPTALELQSYMWDLEYRHVRTGYEEDDKSRKHRMALLADIKGEDISDEDLEDDEDEMGAQYDMWREAFEERQMLEKYKNDYEDGDTIIFKDEKRDRDFLTSQNMEDLKAGCRNEWVNDRIHFGFWISPNQEVENILRLINDVFDRLALSSISPNPASRTSPPDHPLRARIDGLGIMAMEPDLASRDGIRLDPFLPPSDLLRVLNLAYQEKLNAQLNRPFVLLANYISRISTCGDDDRTDDKPAEVADSLSVADLLMWLRRPELWATDLLFRDFSFERTMMGRPTTRTSSPGGSTVSSFDTEREEPRSPLVEVVETDEGTPFDYGIREVRSEEIDENMCADEFSGEQGNQSTMSSPETRASPFAESHAAGRSSLNNQRESSRSESSSSPESILETPMGTIHSIQIATPSLAQETPEHGVSPSTGKRKVTDEIIDLSMSQSTRLNQGSVQVDEKPHGNTINNSLPNTPVEPSIWSAEPVSLDAEILRETGAPSDSANMFVLEPDLAHHFTPMDYVELPGFNFTYNIIPERARPQVAPDDPEEAYTLGFRHLVIGSKSTPTGDGDGMRYPNLAQSINPVLSRRYKPPADPSKIKLLVYAENIPFVPHPLSELDQGTKESIMSQWRDTWAVWRECHCTVCDRARLARRAAARETFWL